MFSSASNLSVVSEALDAMVAKYYDEVHLPQTPASHRLTREQVATTVHMKALNSIVNPGEAVGALCAQVRNGLSGGSGIDDDDGAMEEGRILMVLVEVLVMIMMVLGRKGGSWWYC